MLPLLRRQMFLCYGLLLAVHGCSCASRDWPTHRYNSQRTANQPHRSSLADPSKVPSLHELWKWHPGAVGDPDLGATGPGFSASPIVYKGRIYVGHLNGRMYAIDAAGTMIWKYPPAGSAPLVSTLCCNYSSPGIASTATIASVKVRWFWFLKKSVKVVIFGAPDSSGSGHVWAVNASTGALVWRSPVLASATNNEQIGYDSPVVYDRRVYIGISNDGDNPIIAGKVYALDLQTGALLSGFTTFVASAIRGGGLWSSPAVTPDGDVIVTTGPSSPSGSPAALGLSLRRWTFPPASVPFTSGLHSDWRYIRGAAVWKDAVFAVTGGWDVTADPYEGYNLLHALNTCAPDSMRVRWWLRLPGWGDPTLGAPSVTRGIVYVGTATDTLYAIADTTVSPPTGHHCEVPSITDPTLCTANRVTPIPAVLARVALSGSIRTTPALARGRVYVTTDAGYLHALAP